MDDFLDLLSAHVAAMRVGDPLDDDTTVVARGTAPDGPGFWFAPTVVTPNSPGARAVTEEFVLRHVGEQAAWMPPAGDRGRALTGSGGIGLGVEPGDHGGELGSGNLATG